MKTISSILLISMTIFSCTSTHMLRHNRFVYEDLNKKTEGYAVEIKMINGEMVVGQDFYIAIDSTSWSEAHTNPTYQTKKNTKRTVPTSTVREISFTSRGQGALHGLGWGSFFGLLAGSIYISNVGAEGTRGAFGFMLVGICGLSGTMLGALFGHTDINRLNISSYYISGNGSVQKY